MYLNVCLSSDDHGSSNGSGHVAARGGQVGDNGRTARHMVSSRRGLRDERQRGGCYYLGGALQGDRRRRLRLRLSGPDEGCCLSATGFTLTIRNNYYNVTSSI